MKNYYSILGVDKNASQDEIKRSYRKLSKQWHPDINHSPEAKDRFSEINEAYEVLGNEEKRKEYDNPPPFGGGFGGGMGNGASGRAYRDANGNMHYEWSSTGDMGGMEQEMMREFMRMHGMGGGMGGYGFNTRNYDPNAPLDGQDMILGLGIKFMEAINGCKKTIRVNIEDNDSDNKRVLKKQTIEVTIPKGIPDGMRLRLRGKGNKGYNGGKPGDIYLQIQVGEDDTFIRDGFDLYEKIPVQFETFVLGGKIRIKTLDGEIDYEIKEYSNPGDVITLAGKGSPIMNRLNSYGDLKVVLMLKMPKDLTDEEKKLLGKYKEERAKRTTH